MKHIKHSITDFIQHNVWHPLIPQASKYTSNSIWQKLHHKLWDKVQEPVFNVLIIFR
mgnify:FL=1